MKNITDGELAAGQDLYLRLGAQAMKNRVALTTMNVLDRAAHYWRYGFKGTKIGGPVLERVSSDSLGSGGLATLLRHALASHICKL